MKGGKSLSRTPKARATKVFGIVGMKMCKITDLFTILLRAISLKNVKIEKPANALAHEKVIFGVISEKRYKYLASKENVCVLGTQFHKNPLKSM